jgi:hypothetical protein
LISQEISGFLASGARYSREFVLQCSRRAALNLASSRANDQNAIAVVNHYTILLYAQFTVTWKAILNRTRQKKQEKKLREKRRQEKTHVPLQDAPVSTQGLDRPPAADAAAIVVLLLAIGGFFYSLGRIMTAITTGQNCAGRHCTYWAATPWKFSFEMLGNGLFLLFMVGLMFGCYEVFTTKRDGSPS